MLGSCLVVLQPELLAALKLTESLILPGPGKAFQLQLGRLSSYSSEVFRALQLSAAALRDLTTNVAES